MGIRGRLLILAVGVAVPLVLVGAINLRGMWAISRNQVNGSVKEQAELAAVAFERWADSQRQPLTTIATIAAERGMSAPDLLNEMSYVVRTRPHWIDLRIVGTKGQTLLSQPEGREPPPQALVDHLLSEVQRRHFWTVVTDRTKDESRPIFALAVPVENGGVVIARVDGEAVGELFSDIELSDHAVIAVFDARGRILYRRPTTETTVDRDASSSPLFAALGDKHTAVVEVESPYDEIRRVYGLARTGATGSVLVVGIPSSTLYEPIRRQFMRYGLFSLLALVCAIIAAVIIERSIVKPIQRLRQAAQQLGAGDKSARAPTARSKEIEELGTAFNQMAEQIAEREERLTELDRLKSEFVSGVSHELRTPLTTIKTLSRLLQRGGQTEEERRDYLETISAECDRQIDLVLNLLDLSRIESGALKLAHARVNPSEVVIESVTAERHAAEARRQELRAELSPELPDVFADRSALRRVLCSLIENAIKYTPDGGRINVAARRTGDEVALTVSDNGCGIMPEDLPHVFEKFYRGRPAASETHDRAEAPDYTETPGVGLGLYLARSIVEQLGGRVFVESSGAGGTAVTVALPVWQDESAEVSEEGLNVEAVTGG